MFSDYNYTHIKDIANEILDHYAFNRFDVIFFDIEYDNIFTNNVYAYEFEKDHLNKQLILSIYHNDEQSARQGSPSGNIESRDFLIKNKPDSSAGVSYESISLRFFKTVGVNKNDIISLDDDGVKIVDVPLAPECEMRLFIQDNEKTVKLLC